MLDTVRSNIGSCNIEVKYDRLLIICSNLVNNCINYANLVGYLDILQKNPPEMPRNIINVVDMFIMCSTSYY